MNELEKSKANDRRVTIARQIDEIAASAMQHFNEAGSFEAELAVAQATSDLRVALTAEVMTPVMALMNTDLGFRTDRDPHQFDKKTGKPHLPYPVEVVRDCVIEAKLRGFHVVGNEFNIIAGRFYGARNGLKRKCEKWPGVTDLKIDIGVPKMQAGGAIVPIAATWNRDKVPDSIKTEIPIRVNEFMGSDAIIGKAERKLFKRIHDRLSGTITPEGDAGEIIETTTSAALAQKMIDNPMFTIQSEAPRMSTALQKELGECAEIPAVETDPQPTLTGPVTPQVELHAIVTGAGFGFDDLIKWGTETGNIDSMNSPKGFRDLSTEIARRLVRARAGLLKGLAELKGGAQ